MQNPYLINNKLQESDRNILKDKIINILNISYKFNHTPVLGASGCGAWKNPPKEIALIYKEIIDQEYCGVFDKIVFSILDNNKNNNITNYDIFKNILE